MFVASRTGANALGRGASRSVVLATLDNKKWFQYQKFWGRNHAARAQKYVDDFYKKTLTTK